MPRCGVYESRLMTNPLKIGDRICGYDVRTHRVRCGTVVELLEPQDEREEGRAVIEHKSEGRSTVGWPMVGPWTRSPGT